MSKQCEPDAFEGYCQEHHIPVEKCWSKDTTPEAETGGELRNDEVDVFVRLFEAGQELSRMYEKYDGDMDWTEWLSVTIPKTEILGIPDSGIASILAAHTRRAVLLGKLEELNKLDHNNQMFGDWQQVIEDRITALEAELGEIKR